MNARLITSTDLLGLDRLVQVAVHRRSRVYVANLDAIEQHPEDVRWEATRGPWEDDGVYLYGELGGSWSVLRRNLPLVVRDFVHITPPTVGESVRVCTRQAELVAGTVRAVEHVEGRPEYTTVDVRTASHGVLTVGVGDIIPAEATAGVRR